MDSNAIIGGIGELQDLVVVPV